MFAQLDLPPLIAWPDESNPAVQAAALCVIVLLLVFVAAGVIEDFRRRNGKGE